MDTLKTKSDLNSTLLTSSNKPMITDVFHYTTSRWDWHTGDVNQMWIQEIEEAPDVYRYVAVAYNPRKDTSMVMSNPRGYFDTLHWVRKFCGSFSILP
jgi:hypothetical protein